MLMPSKSLRHKFIAMEKNFELMLAVVGVLIASGTTIYYHGFDPQILGPFFMMICAGLGFGHLTKNWGNRDAEISAAGYQRKHDRMIIAEEQGIVPCFLEE